MEQVNQQLWSIRQDYSGKPLDESLVDENPVNQFGVWMDEAIKAAVPDPNAAVLCTASPDGWPSGRVILLRGFDNQGFSWFTNYLSAKGADLLANPRAELNFFWPALARQVRVQGIVEELPENESDAYFNSRPPESKIGAWASRQSHVIPNRKYLEDQVEYFTNKFGENVPRPENWGGYMLHPVKYEFWQGRESRLHDRIRYSRNGKNWKIERLSP